MRLKRYIVKNMNEAMLKIKNELGNDAIIVSQKKIRKSGVKGFFSKRLIEVTAVASHEKRDIPDIIDESLRAIRNANASLKNNDKISLKNEANNKYSQDIIKEIKDMKEMINKITADQSKISREEDKLKKLLKDNDVDEVLIKRIINKVNSKNENISKKERLRKSIKEMIRINKKKNDGIIIFVGPTGVGKTTTIAKLAGRYSLVDDKKVGLITIDTYRIGAVEQLKTYANIMNIPFKVVNNIADMSKAIEELNDCEVILIDTTGRNSKNIIQISELRAFIEEAKTDNIHLVISCTTKNKDINRIIEGYKKLNFSSVIITKLDETTTYGSILNILSCAKKPLSFVTTGQRVPDDIIKIDKEKLCSLILGEDSI